MNQATKLVLLGDVCPADMVLTQGFGIHSRYEVGEGEKWRAVFKELLNGADISFCNLEAPLIDFAGATATYHFAGPQRFAQYLRRCGLDLVSIANNHVLEEGPEGFSSTTKALHAAQLKFIGKSQDNTSNIEMFKTSAHKIGFAGFNAVDLEKIDNPDKFAEYSMPAAKQALEIMKQHDLDIKLVSIHWGDEYVNRPSPAQIEDAHELIDAGYDIIVGHHPHVIQPIEAYHGGLIIYSLGNCLFGSVHSKNVAHGLCVRVSINHKKEISYECVNLKISDSHGIQIDHSEAAKQRLASILSLTEKWLIDSDYESKYTELVKKKRLRERIKMKLLLLRFLISNSFRGKIMLFRNMYNYYFR